MPPGGTKRVRATPGSESAPGVATRSGKKYITTHPPARQDEQSIPQPDTNAEASNPQPDTNAEASVGQDEEEHTRTPDLGWSAFDEQNNEDEDDVHEDLEAVHEGK